MREAERAGSGCATRAKASVCNASALRANASSGVQALAGLGRASDCKTLGPSNTLGCPKLDSENDIVLLSILGQSRA